MLYPNDTYVNCEIWNTVESQTRTRWTSLYFTPVFSVLLYNVGDLVGRSTATWLKWPGRKAKERYALLVVTILRIGMYYKANFSYSIADVRHALGCQLSLAATGCQLKDSHRMATTQSLSIDFRSRRRRRSHYRLRRSCRIYNSSLRGTAPTNKLTCNQTNQQIVNRASKVE